MTEQPFSFGADEWSLVLAAAETIPVMRRKRFLDLVVSSMTVCSDDVQSAIATALRAIVEENVQNETARRQWAAR